MFTLHAESAQIGVLGATPKGDPQARRSRQAGALRAQHAERAPIRLKRRHEARLRWFCTAFGNLNCGTSGARIRGSEAARGGGIPVGSSSRPAGEINLGRLAPVLQIRCVRYFDHNATHPLSAAARAAWLDAVERFPANPSSPHRWGARASAALEEAREKLARWLGCLPDELAWTSGATEANNAVFQHLGAGSEGTVLVSAVEHPSVRAPARRWLTGRSGTIPVSASGKVDANWVRDRVRRGGVAAVVVMAANNETGVLQPWQALQELCRESKVAFVCDAAQWLGRMPEKGLGAADFLTASAHKFGGPQGVGVMKCPAGFSPLLVGGPQEDGRRAGTENVPGVLAMVAALEERRASLVSKDEGLAEPVQARLAWRDRFTDELKAAVPGVRIVGEGASRLWNTVSVLMPEVADCRRRWVARLDKLGFAVSTGSACASGKEQPSHVLAAMGYRPDESDRMLRISAGWDTSWEDWAALLSALRQTAAEFGVEAGAAAQ